MYKSLLALAIILCSVGSAHTQPTLYSYSEESNLFTPVADVELRTSQGSMQLSDVYGKTPVILTLIFTRCTGICSPFLSGLSENIRLLGSEAQYKVLVVSFDPIDQLTDMESLAMRYGLSKNHQWIFATTPQIADLCSSIGFHPVWDSVTHQFDHEALLVGINENGYINKKLLGLRSPKELHSLISQINNEFVLSYPLPRKNMLFSCFTYDPATGEKSPSVGLLVLLAPAVLTIGILVWLGMTRREDSAAG